MYDEPKYLLAGDQAVVVELGDEVDPVLNRRVHALGRAIEERAMAGVRDMIPTYRSLLVQYDPGVVTPHNLRAMVADAFNSFDEASALASRVVLLPTLYGGEYGPDLEFVAEHAGVTPEAVVATHSGVDYPVYMMGFTPGFPYLGGLDERLATPRLSTPRPMVPAGAVGIAESQTGAYPTASPGGWRLIGRTPLNLFDAQRDPPALLAAGDSVRFVPLRDEAEFVEIRSRVDQGGYQAAAESA